MPRADREQTHRHGIVADVAYRDMIILLTVRPSSRTAELVARMGIFCALAVARRESRITGIDGPHVLLK